MRIESASSGQGEAPAIAPRVEKATGAWFHKISRVVVEVKDPGEASGFRKLNAISLDGWPMHSRTSEQEDELNIAIMQVALAHVEETGESQRFRARYVGGPDASGRPLRKYACFKVSADDDTSTASPFATVMPSMPAGLEPLIPVLRWLMSMLEAREQQLMAYNETLTVKLLESAAQAEPLLRAHGAMSGILEQAVVMLRETLLAKGGVVDGAQLLTGQDNDGLQQVLAMALMQFFSGGKIPPGMMPGMPGMPSEPEAAPTPPPGVEVRPPPGSKPGAGVRFEFDARANTPKAGAVADALVKAIRKLFGSMDGMQMLVLTDALGEAHYESFGAIRTARSDGEAARAVAVMRRTGGWELLREKIGDAQRPALAEIETLAGRYAPADDRSRTPDDEPLLVKNVQVCLGAMDGDRTMVLTGLLSARERTLLQAIRVAETDDDVGKAVVALAEALQAAGTLPRLRDAVNEHEFAFFKSLHALALAHLGAGGVGVEDDDGSVEPARGQRSRGSEKVEAVLCLPPEEESDGIVGPLMHATQAWLSGMDGEGMVLLDALTLKQREAIQGIRAAKSDDEAARAVLAFQAALQHSANWMGMVGRLGQDRIQGMLQIWAMAGHHLRFNQR